MTTVIVSIQQSWCHRQNLICHIVLLFILYSVKWIYIYGAYKTFILIYTVVHQSTFTHILYFRTHFSYFYVSISSILPCTQIKRFNTKYMVCCVWLCPQTCGPLWSHECGSSLYSTGICSRVGRNFKQSHTIAPALQSNPYIHLPLHHSSIHPSVHLSIQMVNTSIHLSVIPSSINLSCISPSIHPSIHHKPSFLSYRVWDFHGHRDRSGWF